MPATFTLTNRDKLSMKKVLIMLLQSRALKWIYATLYALITLWHLSSRIKWKSHFCKQLKLPLIHFNRSEPSEWHFAFHSYDDDEWRRRNGIMLILKQRQSLLVIIIHPCPADVVIVSHEFLMYAHSSLQCHFIVAIFISSCFDIWFRLIETMHFVI